MLRILIQFALVYLVAGAVTNPGDCDEWFSGYTYTIEWEADHFDASTVTIELYEGFGSLVDVIAEDVDNSGKYDWLVPFYDASIECEITGIYILVSSPDHDSESETFAITNPIEWGSANVYAQYNVADTLFKVRWNGPKVPMYEIAYRMVSNPSDISYVSHPSDRAAGEDLDDHVISGLEPNTDYEFRMRYNRTSNASPSEWTDWVQVTTFETLKCTDELMSAWFSLEVYDNIRTGDEKYPGFCGNWVTRFAYSSTSDFVAVYTDHESGRIIVSFRGTEGDNFEDAIDNLGVLADCDVFLSEVDDSKCEISTGFGSNYVYSAIQKIHHVIEEAIADGFDKLIVTGHSQGAALATVAALDYATRYQNFVVDLINFGAPEVGNQEFSDLVISEVNDIVRIVQRDENNEEDEVVGLPTSILPTDVGFVQLDVDATYYFCPLTCREDGVFITSPFYCHCIEGYWTTTADNNVDSNYIFNSLLNNVASAWYTDSGFKYSTQTVSLDASNVVSLFTPSPSTNNNNSPSSNNNSPTSNNNSPSSNNNSPTSNNNSPSSNNSSATVLSVLCPILLLLTLSLL